METENTSTTTTIHLANPDRFHYLNDDNILFEKDRNHLRRMEKHLHQYRNHYGRSSTNQYRSIGTSILIVNNLPENSYPIENETKFSNQNYCSVENRFESNPIVDQQQQQRHQHQHQNQHYHQHKKSIAIRKKSVYYPPTSTSISFDNDDNLAFFSEQIESKNQSKSNTNRWQSRSKSPKLKSSSLQDSKILTDEDISEHISKLINNNKRIIESNTINHQCESFANQNNHSNHFDHRENVHSKHQRTSSFVFKKSSPLYTNARTSPPSTTSLLILNDSVQSENILNHLPRNQTQIDRDYYYQHLQHQNSGLYLNQSPHNLYYSYGQSRSKDNLPMAMENFVFNQTPSTVTPSLMPNSKLQSALLGDCNPSYHSHSNQCPFPITFSQSSISPSSSLPNSNENMTIHKYSESSTPTAFSSLWSASMFGSALSTPPIDVVRHDFTQEDSLFPSLYRKHSQSQNHLDARNSKTTRFSSLPKSSVIINARDCHSMQQHLNFNPNQTNTESTDLVRNLLLSSSMHHNSLNNQSSTKSSVIQNDRQQSEKMNFYSNPIPGLESAFTKVEPSNVDRKIAVNSEKPCIIKNLLLNSSFGSSVDRSINDASHRDNDDEIHRLPPRKRSRIVNHSPTAQRKNQNESKSSSELMTCSRCFIQFRSEQNLEIHQKYYCLDESKPEQTNQNESIESINNLNHQRENVGIVRERKSVVFNRPSIITYSSSNQISDHIESIEQRSLSIIEERNENSKSNNDLSDSNQNSKPNETNEGSDYHFGNILKSKLLSNDSLDQNQNKTLDRSRNYFSSNSSNRNRFKGSDVDECEQRRLALIRRKISEPAYRTYHSSNFNYSGLISNFYQSLSNPN